METPVLSNLQLSLLIALTSLPAHACTMTGGDQEPAQALVRILVFSQSIGRGVPANAQRKLLEIQELLTAGGLAPEVATWGMEGEQRLCVLVEQAQYPTWLNRLLEISGDEQLLKIQSTPGDPPNCG